MVGDFSLFLVQNDLLGRGEDFAAIVAATREKLLTRAPRLDFPESVVTYFQGHLGTPPGGYPEELRAAVLKGLPRLHGRPGEELPPLDLDALGRKLQQKHGRRFQPHEIVSAALYPRVLDEFFQFQERHGDVSVLDTPSYFYGMELGQEIQVDLEPGKTLVISLTAVGEPREDGTRVVFFELNGQGRQVAVRDRALAAPESARRKADPGDPDQVGAPMPGTVIAIHVATGDAVAEGDPLVTLEAMKMETVLRSPRGGKLRELLPRLKEQVQAEDLVAVIGD